MVGALPFTNILTLFLISHVSLYNDSKIYIPPASKMSLTYCVKGLQLCLSVSNFNLNYVMTDIIENFNRL